MMKELEPGAYVTPTVRLLRPLAQGGMGTVWIAEHLVLETNGRREAHDESHRRQRRRRCAFRARGRHRCGVKSPHVVQVFDSGVTDTGVAFIVMELLEGHDLGAHLTARGRMAPGEVATIVSQLSKALAKAHRVGVVHRDIKPENVFLCEVEGGEPFVKLLDFGTAKDALRAPFATTTGQLLGTPYYMSPEQILGEEVDARTDIWSLGVLAFEALTGMRPFEGVTVGAITLAIHTTRPRLTDLVPGASRCARRVVRSRLRSCPERALPDGESGGRRVRARSHGRGDARRLVARSCRRLDTGRAAVEAGIVQARRASAADRSAVRAHRDLAFVDALRAASRASHADVDRNGRRRGNGPRYARVLRVLRAGRADSCDGRVAVVVDVRVLGLSIVGAVGCGAVGCGTVGCHTVGCRAAGDCAIGCRAVGIGDASVDAPGSRADAGSRDERLGEAPCVSGRLGVVPASAVRIGVGIGAGIGVGIAAAGIGIAAAGIGTASPPPASASPQASAPVEPAPLPADPADPRPR